MISIHLGSKKIPSLSQGFFEKNNFIVPIILEVNMEKMLLKKIPFTFTSNHRVKKSSKNQA